MTIHEMVKAAGNQYFPIIKAIQITGLRGRVKNGERVWTPDEARRIIANANPAKN